MSRAITGRARRPDFRLPDSRPVAAPDEHDTKATTGDRARGARVAQPLAWHRRRDRLRARGAEHHAADDAPCHRSPVRGPDRHVRALLDVPRQATTVGVPSLMSVAAFMAPSRTDPSQAIGAVALARMQSATSPMPPPPATAATAAEVAVISDWVAAGYPSGSGCTPTCTSGRTWRGGNEGSPEMNPGMACIQCHAASDEGPRFSIAGTVYPTAARAGSLRRRSAFERRAGHHHRRRRADADAGAERRRELLLGERGRRPVSRQGRHRGRRARDDGGSRRRETATAATAWRARTARPGGSCCRSCELAGAPRGRLNRAKFAGIGNRARAPATPVSRSRA